MSIYPQQQETDTVDNWFLKNDVDMDLLNETFIKNNNSSGSTLGMCSETKFKRMYLEDFKDRSIISNYKKLSDASKQKGDYIIEYNGLNIYLEVKSVTREKIINYGNDVWEGKITIKKRGSRTFSFTDGSTATSALCLKGEFDILAVCYHQFGQKWRFGFILNSEFNFKPFS